MYVSRTLEHREKRWETGKCFVITYITVDLDFTYRLSFRNNLIRFFINIIDAIDLNSIH